MGHNRAEPQHAHPVHSRFSLRQLVGPGVKVSGRRGEDIDLPASLMQAAAQLGHDGLGPADDVGSEAAAHEGDPVRLRPSRGAVGRGAGGGGGGADCGAPWRDIIAATTRTINQSLSGA